MLTELKKQQDLYDIIGTLSEAAIVKLSNYIDFLRYEERMEELEEAEDIAYIKARGNEPAVSFEEVIKEFEEVYK